MVQTFVTVPVGGEILRASSSDALRMTVLSFSASYEEEWADRASLAATFGARLSFRGLGVLLVGGSPEMPL